MDLSITDGVVTVSGISLTGEIDASIASAIVGVDGVVAVRDEVRMMPTSYTV